MKYYSISELFDLQ